LVGVGVTLAGQIALQHGAHRADEAELGTGQVQLVFALLVRERRRAVPRHELADALWPDDVPPTWGSALRSLVSKVRAFLTAVELPADALVSVGGCYQLRIDDAVVDIEDAARQIRHAEEALADGRSRDAAADAFAALATLSQPVLSGVESPWLDAWRAELAELAVQAGELAAAALVASGDGTAAVAAATATIARAPYRESAYRLLMRAHEVAGNRAEALKAYERCRRLVVEELGVDPDPETEALYVRLLGTEPSPPPSDVSGLPPTVVATFLFTDIEGSTSMWERSPDDMSAALALHDDALRAAVDRQGGRVFKHTGDGMCAVFASPDGALRAAVDAQRGVSNELRVRMGVHTGEVQVRDDDYAGVALSRVARLCGLAHGGQVLVSSSTRVAVNHVDDVELRPLGDVQLRGFTVAETVYQLVHADLPDEFPPLGDSGTRRRPVVAEDNELVGRDEELATALAAMVRARLLTITGPGGVGKTRLAISAANRFEDVERSRVWWVELASVGADGVADAVANAVGGASTVTDAVEAIVGAVAGAPAVLVLDNCEHVLGSAAVLVQTLLNRCVDLRVVVTSRIPLGLATEHVITLAPLECPHEEAAYAEIAGSPSVNLLVDRARAVSPRFELDDTNAEHVAEICRRLDGLPLALELAAARIQTMPPAEVVRFLDERLRLLRRTQQDRSGRHRSLEETVRWSYELLNDEERRVFNRLSVFAGSFTPAAAGAVVGIDDVLDVLDVLDALTERSMIVAVATPTEARYRVLETLAEFGRHQLEAETPTAMDDTYIGHRRYYLDVVGEAAVGLQGPHEARWVETLHGDFADIRAVVTRALASFDVDTVLRIVVDLFDYAFFRMRREVGPWAQAGVALPGATEHDLYGPAAAVAGYLAWQRNALDDAERYTMLALKTRPNWVAWDARATIDLFAGRVSDAITAYEFAGDEAEAAGNGYLQSLAIAQIAFAMVFAGLDNAYAVAAAAEPVARATGNPTAKSQVDWAMGISLFDRAPRRALELLEGVMDIALAVDNRLAYGAAATPAEELRTKLASRGVSSDLEAALEQVEYWMTMGNEPNVWLTMRRIARNFAGLGEYEAAALAFGAEEHAASKLPMRAREGDRHQDAIARTRIGLGDDDFERLRAEGAGLTPDALVAELRRRGGAGHGGVAGPHPRTARRGPR
jgi:predicted ATPase/class 3 adenylate cyclase